MCLGTWFPVPVLCGGLAVKVPPFSSYCQYFVKMSQNMVNKPTEHAEKIGENPLKEFPPTFELFFHCFLRLHQLKFLISTGLNFRKISKTLRNPEYGKVR